MFGICGFKVEGLCQALEFRDLVEMTSHSFQSDGSPSLSYDLDPTGLGI